MVDNSKVTADQDFTVDAHNKVTTKFNAASLGAGGAAIATGVGVNTIGTSTLAKVNQSTVTARKAAVASREELDVDQNLVGATVGGLGINANVMVTSIGTKLADTYGSSDNKGASFDTAAVLQKANTALDAQKTATADGTTASSKVVKDTLHNTDTGVKSTDASGVTASSGKSDAKGTQVAVTNAAITTADTLDLSADRKTDAQITAAAASLGSVDLSATVAVLDAKKDAGVTVSGSTLTAGKDLSVLAEQSGTTGITAYQGNISALAGISAAYAQSSSSGSTAITLDQSTLKTKQDSTGHIAVKAEDTGATSSKVVGVTTGAFGGGALITKADNKSGTGVSLKDSTLSGQKDVAVTSRRANTVAASTTGGVVKGQRPSRAWWPVLPTRAAAPLLSPGRTHSAARPLELTAQGQPRVSADAKAIGVSLVGGGASVATAEAGGTVALTAAEGSSFTADSVELTASSGQQSEETKDSSGNTTTVYDNAKAEAVGNATAIGASVGVNKASAKQATTVKVDLGKGIYKTDSPDGERVQHGGPGCSSQRCHHWRLLCQRHQRNRSGRAADHASDGGRRRYGQQPGGCDPAQQRVRRSEGQGRRQRRGLHQYQPCGGQSQYEPDHGYSDQCQRQLGGFFPDGQRHQQRYPGCDGQFPDGCCPERQRYGSGYHGKPQGPDRCDGQRDHQRQPGIHGGQRSEPCCGTEGQRLWRGHRQCQLHD